MQLCQVAVPLVYWDYEQELFRFSLWPLREIFIDSGSESVATKQMQTLAFIRIGDKRKCSKSKLINQFLRGQNDEHSTFFHKDCLLGHCKRSFANGTIEASWYIPKSNTKNDDSRNPNEKEKKIEQPLTILNLRGDAFSFPEQLHFLTNFANALVLIIDYEDIESEKYLPVLAQIHASEAYVIIITSLPHDDNETEQFIQMYEEKTNLSYEKCSILSTTSEGRHLNEIEVKQFLINDIYDTLHHKIMVSLEEISERLPTDFCCDEELSKSLSGKQLCDEIISKIEGNQWKRELEKRDILPLQGETLWHEWSKEQKEERRSGKQEKINFNEPHLERMRILRMKQICIFEETSDTMARFVQILLTLINDKQTTLFFLSWLRQYMDSRSRTILPCVLNSLRKAFHEFEFIRSQKGGENADENEKKLAQLKETISIKEKKLAHSSFGLEHFFREMGQLFEAFIYCKDDLPCTVTEKTREVIYSLPLIAATLLCWGQPLEVMDGDAANVPLKWIDAVFHEVSKIIGENKRLFAISVLGIQSSGKSTLLNTMFGLQFAVSAGRCTRGIFIQLVPVDKKKSSLKFDYAMVIDTEGLRAPELAGEKVNHDNELATLVIGMGDVAIINIKGETIADMEDVLQIVVHALIRLKQANEKINLKQSCVFVHQNVSAQDADKMTIQGNQKIVNNLDKMTKEVAIEEHVGNIKSFQDVISFNPIKHVKYIPDLWHGTPPMAPASSQYSTSVTEVANCILTDLTSDKNHSYLSFQSTRDHLQSLWNGILYENFVFSFRNVLEVKAYSLLENKFQELTFQLDELKLKWLHDNLRPKIRQCENVEDLENKESTLLITFSKLIDTKTKAIAEELEHFFKESDLSDYMVHWKGRKDTELDTTSRAIITDVRQKLSVEKEKCKALMESNDRILKNQKEIQKLATDFAKTVKGKQKTPSEEEIRMKFKEAWKKWVDDIVKKNPESDVEDDINKMKSDTVDLLYDRYSKHEGLLKEGLKAQSVETWGEFYILRNSMTIDDINPKFISVHSKWEKVIEFVWREKCRNRAHQFINLVFTKVDMYVTDLEPDNEYDPTIFSQILRIVTDNFQAHYRDSKHGYTLTIPLEITVALHVARFSVYRFSEMIKAFKSKSSLRSRIESSRKETEAYFVGICTAKANEVIVSNVFCLEMKPLLQEKVERELYMHIIKKIAYTFQYTKYPLIKAILTDLAEKKDFEKFMQYITCCESYSKLWITDYTKTHFRKLVENGNTYYAVFAMEALGRMITEIKKSVEKASSEPKSPLNVAEWIKNFLLDLEQHTYNFSREPFHSIKNLGIKNFKDLSSVIKKNLDDIQEELNEMFKKSDIESVSWKDESPYKVIMEKLWGCPETCPWCKEPCATTSRFDKHEHFCVQHRPQGVNGIHSEGSEELVLENCNYLIETDMALICGDWCNCPNKDSQIYHPYKDYKNQIPTWDIKPSPELSKYWYWFIKIYGKRLAKLYDLTLPRVPDEWKIIKRKDAISSLSYV